jgi:hypothetical protein
MIAWLLDPTIESKTVKIVDAASLDELKVGQATPTACLYNYHYIEDKDEVSRNGRRFRKVQVVFCQPDPGRTYMRLDWEVLWKLLTGEQQTASQVTDVLLRVE